MGYSAAVRDNSFDVNTPRARRRRVPARRLRRRRSDRQRSPPDRPAGGSGLQLTDTPTGPRMTENALRSRVASPKRFRSPVRLVTSCCRAPARVVLAVIPLLCLLLGACASDLQRAERLRSEALSESEPAYDLAALVRLEEAKETLGRGSNSFFEDQAYIDAARYTTDQALLYLLNDQPMEAERTFLEAIQTLNRDVQDHKQHIVQRNKRMKQRVQKVVGMLTGITFFASAKALGDVPEINQWLFALTQGIGEKSLDLTYALLEEVRVPLEQAPRHLEADFFRMPLFAHFHALAAIGRLELEGARRCTVSLVGKRLALTNAHCVVDEAGRPIASGLTVSFDKLHAHRKLEAKPDERAAYLGIPARPLRISPAYLDPSSGRTAFDRCRVDWALLELERHPPDVTPFVATPGHQRRFPEPAFHPPGGALVTRVAVAGYSSDLNSGELITMDYGCPLGRLFDVDVMTYRCATWKGASGAPVLAAGGPGNLARLLGVHACGPPGLTPERLATEPSRDGLESLGTPATEFLPALRSLQADSASTAPQDEV